MIDTILNGLLGFAVVVLVALAFAIAFTLVTYAGRIADALEESNDLRELEASVRRQRRDNLDELFGVGKGPA